MIIGRLARAARTQVRVLDKEGNPGSLADFEFGQLACQILENGYLNGETIRLDGAIRMAPR